MFTTVEIWDRAKHRDCRFVHVDSDGNGYCERHSHWVRQKPQQSRWLERAAGGPNFGGAR